MKFLVNPKVVAEFSARCGVQSGKCGVQSGKCGITSSGKCGIQSGRV